jgi:tetratricopeptide (TPR) repeat protein
MILMLADVYYQAERYPKAIELCSKIIWGVAPKVTRDQLSWAYFMRGRNIHGQMLPLDAVDDFRKAVEVGQKGAWRATAMFYLANAIFNYQHDTAQAIGIWQSIAARFPNSPEAEEGAYYIGFALQTSGRLQDAKNAYELFLKTFPKSAYTKVIRTEHLREIAESFARRSQHGEGRAAKGLDK